LQLTDEKSLCWQNLVVRFLHAFWLELDELDDELFDELELDWLCELEELEDLDELDELEELDEVTLLK